MQTESKKMHWFALLFSTIILFVLLLIGKPCYAEASEVEYDLSNYSGVIFKGENVCSVRIDPISGGIGIPHQYYWVEVGDNINSYDLYCSCCNGFFGRGLETEDGNICVYDFDKICGNRHFIFDHNGNKLKVEQCKPVKASYESEETHFYYCKCGLGLFEAEHNVREEIEKATLKNNGFYSSFCDECNEQLTGRTIYRPKSFTISKTKTEKYAGKNVPKLTIKTSNGKILPSKFYTVKKVSGSTKSKNFKYTITFKGEYKGSKVVNFKYKNGKWVLS